MTHTAWIRISIMAFAAIGFLVTGLGIATCEMKIGDEKCPWLQFGKICFAMLVVTGFVFVISLAETWMVEQ